MGKKYGIAVDRTSTPLSPIKQKYVFRNESAIESFLLNNRQLFPILEEAYFEIKEYFGDGFRNLVLELIEDPESDKDKDLVIFIQTDLSADEALSRLDALDNNWWLKKMSTIAAGFCIDLEFL